LVSALGELVDGLRQLMEEVEDTPGGPAMAGLTLYQGLDELVDFGEELLENTVRRRQRMRSPVRKAVKPKKRKKSAWNVFVAAEMPKVLKKHPRFTPQRAMKEVSRRWRNSPKNPNRRKRR